MRMALSYVEKDLMYHKQHPELKIKAGAWQAVAAAKAPLPLLPPEEAVFWRGWLRAAEQRRLNQRPTGRMKEHLAASEMHSSRRRELLRA